MEDDSELQESLGVSTAIHTRCTKDGVSKAKLSEAMNRMNAFHVTPTRSRASMPGIPGM